MLNRSVKKSSKAAQNIGCIARLANYIYWNDKSNSATFQRWRNGISTARSSVNQRFVNGGKIVLNNTCPAVRYSYAFLQPNCWSGLNNSNSRPRIVMLIQFLFLCKIPLRVKSTRLANTDCMKRESEGSNWNCLHFHEPMNM